jgi:hypothetical protein
VAVAAQSPGCPSRFRGNAVLVLAGAFLAVVTDALFNLGIRLVPGVNLTPPLLVLTGILVALSSTATVLLNWLP